MKITASDVVASDGTLDFSGGVNSVAVTTIQSETNPNGLARNELAWMNNGTVRDGGISPRAGWHRVGIVHEAPAYYQGGYMYEPNEGNPYIVCSLGGHIWAVNMTTGAGTELVNTGPINPANNQPQFNPEGPRQAYFAQGEEFLIIQAGDYVTLPLFWDGAVLRRSIGITNPAPPGYNPGINEIPAGGPMDYYMGRLWWALGRQYAAGDIVGGTSGTAPYNFRDAILNVTENPLVLGGDGFTVPTNAGNIRALKHGANIDAALGEGRLFIFTRKEVYALQVPVSRQNWIDTGNETGVGNPQGMPLQTVVQMVNGSVNDRSVVAVNGDLFYQSLEPGIRSLIQSMRFFTQWGNVQISANEHRLLQFNNRELLWASSGIAFNNRLLQTGLPKEDALGVLHQAVVPLDFIPISKFASEKKPNWEGMYEGLDFLQLFVGDFGGLERAFGLIIARETGALELWELTQDSRTEEDDGRITWVIEFPAMTWERSGWEGELKKLIGCDIWIDRLWGTAQFTAEWRPDSDNCWYHWHSWNACCPRNSAEDPANPISYPLIEFGESYRATMSLPTPPEGCASAMGRPRDLAYQHQLRLTIKGYCRIRGVWLHATRVLRKTYPHPTC